MMKPVNFLRYVLLPAIALGAGVKLGIMYAQGHYVAKDRKFIEGEVVKEDSYGSSKI
jgi:hypothetical protein